MLRVRSLVAVTYWPEMTRKNSALGSGSACGDHSMTPKIFVTARKADHCSRSDERSIMYGDPSSPVSLKRTLFPANVPGQASVAKIGRPVKCAVIVRL